MEAPRTRRAFQSNRTGSSRLWLLARDSVSGPWHEAVQLTDFECYWPSWAPDGGGVLCRTVTGLAIVSPQGRVLWRRDMALADGLTTWNVGVYARDGRTAYLLGEHRDGRRGIWAVPLAGGSARLVILWDDRALGIPFALRPDVGPDRVYLTVSEYESDIWVANVKC